MHPVVGEEDRCNAASTQPKPSVLLINQYLQNPWTLLSSCCDNHCTIGAGVNAPWRPRQQQPCTHRRGLTLAAPELHEPTCCMILIMNSWRLSRLVFSWRTRTSVTPPWLMRHTSQRRQWHTHTLCTSASCEEIPIFDTDHRFWW